MIHRSRLRFPAAVLSAAALLACQTARPAGVPIATESAPRAEAPVVIVGAGLTGLTTAYELRKSGIDVLVLEAAPRVGGRIQTVSFPDSVHVEAHMEEYWERSPAVPLLKELGLELEPDTAHSTVRIGGRILPYQGEGDRDTYLRGVFSDAEREAFLRWNAKVWAIHERLRGVDLAGADPLPEDLQRLTTVSFADWVRAEALPEKVADWIRVTLEPEMAIEWDEVAALDGIDEMRLFLDTPDGFGETNYHVKGGNTGFVQALVAKVGSDRIVTQAQVTALEQTPTGVRVRYLHQGARYREAAARAVVVTVPLYQIGRIQFLPPLGDEKRRAIATTRFGAYIKVHFRMAAEAAPLWESDGSSMLTMLSDSPAGSIYEATDFQPTGTSGERYLTLLIHARFARQMATMTADEMRDHAVASLDAVFPGIARHVRMAEVFAYPTSVAYWPVKEGRSRFDALARELRRPHGRIWIGGDTTENSHSEGAVQAALRISKELVARKAEVLGR